MFGLCKLMGWFGGGFLGGDVVVVVMAVVVVGSGEGEGGGAAMQRCLNSGLLYVITD